ncbi:MAG: XamI family restriction endonuclease, partial [Planctomycetota bacterium]
EGREPTEAERNGAVLASACLWAYQRTQTTRRSSGKKRLEGLVSDCLVKMGFEQERPRDVKLLQHAPGVGRFCGECSIGGRRADFVVGLWDGRHSFVECKDTNSYVNSVKRLNNDTAAKATHWLKQFGELAVVPVAVISGIFYRHRLQEAQEAGLALFWGHGMNEFCRWLRKVKKSTV